MSQQIKPITIWGEGGPNPPKIAMLLKELDIPHETIATPFSDVKKPAYLAINPNGRLPAIGDPNTGITLWESDAIVEYLIDRYDPTHNLSFPRDSTESYHAKQWLFFQVSGQGPYYGQVSWFKAFHAEKVPSAIERYVKELNRVTGVLEGHLAKQKAASGGDEAWLVGNKISFADIAFVPWQIIITKFAGPDEYNVDDYPHVKQWLSKMTSRQSVKEAMGSSL
jgi:glutathione S-transferase